VAALTKGITFMIKNVDHKVLRLKSGKSQKVKAKWTGEVIDHKASSKVWA
jgi:hypothetical protein